MDDPPIPILIVDDDLSVQNAFKGVLETAGYSVTLASNAIEAAALLQAQVLNLAIIGLKLSDPSGLDLVQRLQGWQPECAILLTSNNPSREELLEALRVSVDDFLIKRVQNENLRRAVGQAVLKHPTHQPGLPEVTVGALRIDTKQRMAYWHTQPLTLTPTEYCVLLALAQQVSQVLPASLLIRLCRGYSVSEGDARVLIKPHVANLRQKLEQGGRYKRILLNHRGRGYVLKCDECDM